MVAGGWYHFGRETKLYMIPYMMDTYCNPLCLNNMEFQVVYLILESDQTFDYDSNWSAGDHNQLWFVWGRTGKDT